MYVRLAYPTLASTTTNGWGGESLCGGFPMNVVHVLYAAAATTRVCSINTHICTPSWLHRGVDDDLSLA
jgi:hypothetical protein